MQNFKPYAYASRNQQGENQIFVMVPLPNNFEISSVDVGVPDPENNRTIKINIGNSGQQNPCPLHIQEDIGQGTTGKVTIETQEAGSRKGVIEIHLEDTEDDV